MQDLRPITRHAGLLNPAALSKLRWALLESRELSWYFYPEANFDGEKPDLAPELTAYEDCPQFVHCVVRHGQPNSRLADLVLGELGLISALAEAGVSGGLARVKANLTLARGESVVSQPHYDSAKPGFSALVYVNDSDGDTVFFDRALGDDLAGMSEATRHTPAAGDIVVFDPRQYHAASTPARTKARAVLNCLVQ